MIVFQDTALANTTVVGSLEIQAIALIYMLKRFQPAIYLWPHFQALPAGAKGLLRFNRRSEL